MKVRIGYGIGTQGLADGGARFGELIDALEALGFDSIWCSERATGPIPEPMVSLAFAAGRTKKLKLGTSVQVLPGRNPVLLAKQWASLDVLSGGRALPAFGLGVVEPHEQQAFGVTREERAPWFDEALPLIRRLWSEDVVDHDGPRFHYEGVSIGTRPVQQPPDVWLGGRAPRELRRVGELADGWLPSFCTPAQVAEGREMVEAAAATTGRTIDDEHYGAMVFYARTEVPEPYASMVGARLGFDAAEVIAVGLPALARPARGVPRGRFLEARPRAGAGSGRRRNGSMAGRGRGARRGAPRPPGHPSVQPLSVPSAGGSPTSSSNPRRRTLWMVRPKGARRVRRRHSRASTARSPGAPPGHAAALSSRRLTTDPQRASSTAASRASIGASALHRSPRHTTSNSSSTGAGARAASRCNAATRCGQVAVVDGQPDPVGQPVPVVGRLGVGADEQQARVTGARELRGAVGVLRPGQDRDRAFERCLVPTRTRPSSSMRLM